MLDTRSEILSKHAKKGNRQKNIKVVGIVSIRGSDIDQRSRPFVKVDDGYLIDRTISVLRQCKDLEKIIITTPDKILHHVNQTYDKNRIIGLERPVEFARINKSSIDTINHALEYGVPNETYDYFFGSSIETPFKRKEYIESGINIASIFKVDTVIGVRQNNQKLFRHNGQSLVSINSNQNFFAWW